MYTFLIAFWPFFSLIIKKSYFNIWIYPNTRFNDNQQEKITKNLIGFSNTVITSCLGLVYFHTQNQIIFKLGLFLPATYYIYDTYLIIARRIKADYPHIYHHLVTLYLLEFILTMDDDIRNVIFKIFIIAEIGNLPLYPVYHLIKVGNKETLSYYQQLIFYKITQLLIYSSVRICYFSYVLYHYNNLFNNHLGLKYMLITIYFIGIYWISGQYNSLIGDYKKKRELMESDKFD